MTIFKTMTKEWVTARKEHDTDKAIFLGTFLNDMRHKITKGVSAAMYGIYDPEDSVVISYLKNGIKNTVKAVEEVVASKVETDTSKAFIAKGNFEVAILESYLPKQLSDFELGEIIGKYVKETDLSGGKLMGFVMSQLKKEYEGLYDASKVKSLLGL